MSYEDLMQERPDGIEPSVTLEEIAEGFTILTPEADRLLTDGGMTSHRTVLQEGEHTDADVL